MPPAKSKPAKTPLRRNPPQPPPEVVDPAWLLKAIAVSLVAALVCAWFTASLLVYQGEWQLVLHPSRTVAPTPAQAGIAYSDLRFDAAEAGQPRLDGWWIPAVPNTNLQPTYAAFTILLLHNGSGSLANAVPLIERLHSAGLNVFAFDYRGFGASDNSAHPSAGRMAEDAADALKYLEDTRHISAHNIIPYGVGLGASLAATLAATHPDLPAVILDNPNPDPAAAAVAAHPSHIVPVRLLFGNQFDIAAPLLSLATPKLLIAGGISATESDHNPNSLQMLFDHAASPRLSVSLPKQDDAAEYRSALTRFLDQYLAVQ